jgi:hypothetical protein
MSKRFTALIFRWLNQVNADPELPATALKVCVELAGCFRESKKGMAWPGLQTIADTITKSKATVLNAIRLLEQRGHLKVQYGRPGAGHSNHYWMVEKGQPANLSARPKKVRKKGQPANLSPLRTSSGGVLQTPPPEAGERGGSLGSDPIASDPGVAPLRGAPGFVEEPEQASPPEEPIAPESSGTAPRVYRREDDQAATPSTNPLAEDGGAHTAWRELCAVWRRGHPADDTPKAIAITRAAYVKVIAQGTPPELIVAAAKVWSAAADAPRFLPQLATWLATGGFEQKPPAKRERRSNTSGSVRRDRLPRQNGKVDLTALTLRRAGYIEDENGNLYHPDGNAGSAFWWGASS